MSSLKPDANKKLPVVTSPPAEHSAPTYWKSLAELEGRPEFVARARAERVEDEVESPSSPERRQFMQIMSAGAALAAAAGCRWQEDHMLPMSRTPEGRVAGETRRFATACDIGGTTVGVHAISYDGRPIKLEGNPSHPSNRGALGLLHQAQVLELYDPDRSRSPQLDGQPKTWVDFDAFARGHFEALKASGGGAFAVIASASSSPSRAALRARLTELLPQATWVEWEPGLGEGSRLGTQLAYGAALLPHYDFAKADVVVSLDADPLDDLYPSGLANARAFAARRDPDQPMSRVYAIESAYTQLGSQADHHQPLRAELIRAFAVALDAEVSAAVGASGAQPKPTSAALNDPKIAKLLTALAKDLAAAKGRSLVVAGEHQPPEVHALVCRLNAILDNVGKTVSYTEHPNKDAPARVAQLEALTAKLGSAVSTVLVLGANPVYTAPQDLGFAAAYAKVQTRIHVGTYHDETGKASGWHLPEAHWLETWGDVRAADGTLSIQQPLIEALFGGRSQIEVLASLLGETHTRGLDIVKHTHRERLADPRKFRRTVHDGLIDDQLPRVSPELKALDPIALGERDNAPLDAQNGQLELVLAADSKVYDGRFGNSSWLQELPEQNGKLAWGNAAVMSPATAAALGLTDGQEVTLTIGGQSARTHAMIVPGTARGSVRLTLGYGRTRAGRVGGHDEQRVEPVGISGYALQSSKSPYFAGGLQVSAGAGTIELSASQDVHTMDQLGREGTQSRLGMIVREGTVEKYKKEPDFAKHAVHHPPLLSLWNDPVVYDGHKWGMTIDLNKCIGCSACITACQAENNIPSVGAKNLARGREMLWLRVDRYFKGDPDNPEVAYQPLPCMQCENAPCEQVCPVGATMHSSEGLNDMVYNRCIGTRYCANNCPYKVRRFNYLNYNLDVQAVTPYHGFRDEDARIKAMVFNPEVSIRARGVIEKCTFCVQRIQNVKIKAKNAKRSIKDGDIRTACQETCPTQAIEFGDLNDSGAKVAQLAHSPRSYGLLEELNNRPRVRYLARVKNPNPELG
ncbi:MAG: TAT-variant-translocated molybdopterin oxidoreductase [Polyangiaceae bacterium]|nr:TAT-variant-translocated molybdopterin oxidoreductase [Polyangiaceae bacterium]